VDFEAPGVALASAPPSLRRNFVRAHEILGDFFLAQLGAHVPARGWRAPRDEVWMHVTTYQVRDTVLTNTEFFHLAERDPAAADSAAQRLATLGIVPFTESSLNRLALLASSRRPKDGLTIYGIVARGFPHSA